MLTHIALPGPHPTVGLHAFASGLSLMAALIVAIGAQNTFVLRQGLRREHVGLVVAFCAAADGLLVTAGVAGLARVLKQAPALTLALTLGGVGFLLWYGWGALRRAMAPTTLVTDQGAGRASLGATLGRTAAFTLLNPHVYIDTVLLMGTIGSTQPAGARPAFVVGAGLASALWFAGLGFGAQWLAPLFAKPWVWRILDAAVAALMLALAYGLVAKLL